MRSVSGQERVRGVFIKGMIGWYYFGSFCNFRGDSERR